MNKTAARAKLDAALAAHKASLLLPAEERPSIQHLAAIHGVNAPTLQRRVNGASVPREDAYIKWQALSPAEELLLVEHVRSSQAVGHPLPSSQVWEIARAMLAAQLSIDIAQPGAPRILGLTYLQKLRKRHPELEGAYTRPIAFNCSKADDPATLCAWFNQVAQKVKEHGFMIGDIYNMDESGYGIGLSQTTRVLIVVNGKAIMNDPGQHRAWKKSQGKQEWCLTVECVSAAGAVLPPMIIYKGTGPFTDAWRPRHEQHKGWIFKTSNKGWTSDELACQWLREVFLPCSDASVVPPSPRGDAPLPGTSRTRDDPNWPRRRLLIMDGHRSHVKPQFLAICIANNADVMIMPSHASHILQPLNVGIFAPLKYSMALQTDKAARNNPKRIHKCDWANNLAKARARALTPANVQVGWHESGLWPLQ